MTAPYYSQNYHTAVVS